VLGVEGSAGLVARAADNAVLNSLVSLCKFETANLFNEETCSRLGKFDKMLIDPPREGAIDLVNSLASGARQGSCRLSHAANG